MKGLLKKDLYMLWAYCRIYLLLLPLFLLAGYFQPDTFFFAVYPSIIVGMLPATLLSYEEKCKWDLFCLTLPVPRWKVVAEKYLLSVLGTGMITLISAIVQFGIFLQSRPFDYEGYQAILTLLITLGFGGPSLLLPVVFRLGMEKGRLAYYFVVGGACAIGGILTVFTERIRLPQLPSLAIVLACLVMFLLSYLLSIQFYEKREL